MWGERQAAVDCILINFSAEFYREPQSDLWALKTFCILKCFLIFILLIVFYGFWGGRLCWSGASLFGYLNSKFDPQLVLTSNKLILFLIKKSILRQIVHNNPAFTINLISIDMNDLIKLTDNKRNE